MEKYAKYSFIKQTMAKKSCVYGYCIYIYIYIYSHIFEYGYIIKEKRKKGYKISVNMSWEGKR